MTSLQAAQASSVAHMELQRQVDELKAWECLEAFQVSCCFPDPWCEHWLANRFSLQLKLIFEFHEAMQRPC